MCLHRKRALLTYEEKYEVQSIIARRCMSRAAGTFEYLVCWKDYGVAGDMYDTWEPEAHLPKGMVAKWLTQLTV